MPDSHGPRDIPLDDRALFAEIASRANLVAGWMRVWENGGAGGGDGVSVQAFSRQVVTRLGNLENDLKDGSYVPGPLRSVHIPKDSGQGLRRLDIPCVRDRVAQTAAALVLAPLFDLEFEASSFGYRAGKSVSQAVASISAARAEGFEWVIDADIEDYFGSIEHSALMERWAESVGDGPLTQLVWKWITHAAPIGRGVPQGSPLSPLLANLFLDRLDEAFHSWGARMVRFADDFVILCRSESGAENALKRVSSLLADQGLALNEDKTSIVDFDRGFRFLGHLFVRSMAMKTTPERADEAVVTRLLRQAASEDESARAEADAEERKLEMAEAAGYSPGLRVLYIHTPDRRLCVRNQALTVEAHEPSIDGEERWRELIAVPHQQVDRIELGRSVAIGREVIDHLLASDTPVAFVNGHGETQGWLANGPAPRAGRHMAQARLCLDDTKRLELARIVVTGRLRNQRAVLRRLLGGRKHPPEPVTHSLIGLNRLIGRGAGKGPLFKAATVNELLGNEGAGGAAWWAAVGHLLPDEMRFRNRVRPGAGDPANICFNFLSHLLERDVTVAVIHAGLHPGFGALHSPADRNDACVYDLMEEFRAHLIGGLTVYCANRRIVRPDMFETDNGHCRMLNEGARALVRAYEARIARPVKSPRHGRRVTWRRLMVEQAFALAAHYEGSETYTPYDMDY